jgi:hypothetical protein
MMCVHNYLKVNKKKQKLYCSTIQRGCEFEVAQLGYRERGEEGGLYVQRR